MRSIPIKIAVVIDQKSWHYKFSDAINLLSSVNPGIQSISVDIGGPNWIEKIRDCQAVIWNPHYMGLRLASHFKEKIYFMEKFLGKIVFPNVNPYNGDSR